MAEIYTTGWDISSYKNTFYKIRSTYEREILINNAKREHKHSRDVIYNNNPGWTRLSVQPERTDTRVDI